MVVCKVGHPPPPVVPCPVLSFVTIPSSESRLSALRGVDLIIVRKPVPAVSEGFPSSSTLLATLLLRMRDCSAYELADLVWRLPINPGKKRLAKDLKAGMHERMMARWTSISDQMTTGIVSPGEEETGLAEGKTRREIGMHSHIGSVPLSLYVTWNRV